MCIWGSSFSPERLKFFCKREILITAYLTIEHLLLSSSSFNATTERSPSSFDACCATIFAPSLPSSKVEEKQVENAEQIENDHDSGQIIPSASNDTDSEENTKSDEERGAPTSFDFPSKPDRLLVLDMLNNPQFSLRLRAIGAPVYGMRCLTYDKALESAAFKLASRCTGMRSKGNDKPPGYPDILEAVSVSGGNNQPTYADALRTIYLEGQEARYDPMTGACAVECRNYKAMMFKDNDAVGCSRIACSKIEAIGDRAGYVTVCLFGASSPYDYQRRAYDIGQQCTQSTCPAKKPLCDSGGLCCDKMVQTYSHTTPEEYISSLFSTNIFPASLAAGTLAGRPLSTTTVTQTKPISHQLSPTLNQMPLLQGGQLPLTNPSTGMLGNGIGQYGQVPGAGALGTQLPGTGAFGNQLPGTGVLGNQYGSQIPGYSQLGSQLPGTLGTAYSQYGSQLPGTLGSQYSQFGNQLPGALGSQYSQYGNQLPGTLGSQYSQYGSQLPSIGGLGTTSPLYGNQLPGTGIMGTQYGTQMPGGALATQYPQYGTQGMYGTQTPGMYGTQQMPGMYGTQTPGMYGTQTPGIYGTQMPGMYQTQMPGMYGSQMPGMYGTQTPGMYGTQMPGMYGGQMPGMYGNQMSGMYGGQSGMTPYGTSMNQGMMYGSQYQGSMQYGGQYPMCSSTNVPYGPYQNQYGYPGSSQYPGMQQYGYQNQYPYMGSSGAYPGTMGTGGTYPGAMGVGTYPGAMGMGTNPGAIGMGTFPSAMNTFPATMGTTGAYPGMMGTDQGLTGAYGSMNAYPGTMGPYQGSTMGSPGTTGYSYTTTTGPYVTGTGTYPGAGGVYPGTATPYLGTNMNRPYPRSNGTADDERQMPNYGGQMPMYGGQTPMYGGQMPMYGGQMPMTGGQMPMNGGQMPMNGGQMPMNGGQMPMYGGGGYGDTGSSFCYNGNQMVARCPPGQFTWYQHTWKIGGVRNYYIPRGRKFSFNECMYDCGMQDDCYFATMTNSGNCYLLTTSSSATCRYFSTGHFGPVTDRCTLDRPCQSAYKICMMPRCSLISLVESYCKDANPQTALSKCRPGFCTSGFCTPADPV